MYSQARAHLLYECAIDREVSQQVEYLLALLDNSGLPPVLYDLCVEWLQQVKELRCDQKKSFDEDFLLHYMYRQMRELELWVIEKTPTEKMQAIKRPLRLPFPADHNGDTDKTQALPQLVI
jgi:hypothetical protein